MSTARRQTLLFLACAAVLLGAGYGWGYAAAYGRFYSPEAQLERELLNMDFHSRVLHFVNLGRPADCRRELVSCLEEETRFVGQQLAADPAKDARAAAEASVRRARLVVSGQRLAGE